MNTITLLQPDDWHAHLRDGLALKRTVPDLAAQFKRAICMPNLVPPVKTVEEALAYRERIMAHVPEGNAFDPRMVLYFTDSTPASEVKKIKDSEHYFIAEDFTGKIVKGKVYKIEYIQERSGMFLLKKIQDKRLFLTDLECSIDFYFESGQKIFLDKWPLSHHNF